MGYLDFYVFVVFGLQDEVVDIDGSDAHMQQIDGEGEANYYVDSSDIHESQDQGNVFALLTLFISIHS